MMWFLAQIQPGQNTQYFGVVQAIIGIVMQVVAFTALLCGGAWWLFRQIRGDKKEEESSVRTAAKMEAKVEAFDKKLDDVLAEVKESRNEMKVVATHEMEIAKLVDHAAKVDTELAKMRESLHDVRGKVLDALLRIVADTRRNSARKDNDG